MSNSFAGTMFFMSFTFLVLSVYILPEAVSVYGQIKAANFSLKNQNDQTFDVNFPSDKVVILIFGDRKGAGQIEGWSAPLYKKYDGKVYVFGIASLSGVPSYAQGLVRQLIKLQTSYSVLLDWGGIVSESFGYESDTANIIVIGKNGRVITTRSGAATSGVLENLYREIDKGL